MKQALSALGVAYVLYLAEKYDIEPGKLIDVFNEIAPDDDEEDHEN